MFEGPGLHLLVVAVQEGALGSRALHIIHMDESCTCRRESTHGMDLKPFLTIIKKRQHSKSPHMGGPKHRALSQATRTHRLADFVTQRGTHTDTQDCVYFQLNFAFIFWATMKTCLGKMIFFFTQEQQKIFVGDLSHLSTTILLLEEQHLHEHRRLMSPCRLKQDNLPISQPMKSAAAVVRNACFPERRRS